ncbi:MAG: hypothetical protein DLM58_08940 [Pseudonocardiales bacterium]|nr:MAG: hypothetical protein DLM58_08940 [Pseudonocardiales bacterium]
MTACPVSAHCRPRLVATSWLVSDSDDLSVVHSNAETMRFVRQGRPETRAETAYLVDQYIAEHAAKGFTKWRLADLDGHLVGRAGFGSHREGRELGYTIRRDLLGKGLATEIGAALVTRRLNNAAGCPPLHTSPWTTRQWTLSWRNRVRAHPARRSLWRGVRTFRVRPGS